MKTSLRLKSINNLSHIFLITRFTKTATEKKKNIMLASANTPQRAKFSRVDLKPNISEAKALRTPPSHANLNTHLQDYN